MGLVTLLLTSLYGIEACCGKRELAMRHHVIERFTCNNRSRLASIPRRVAWYPGSGKKYATFKKEFPDAEEFGIEVPDGSQHAEYFPWLLRANLSPKEVSVPEAKLLLLDKPHSSRLELHPNEDTASYSPT